MFIALSMEATHNGTHNTPIPGYSPSVESIAILVRVRGNPVGGRRSASGKGTPVLFSLKGKYSYAPGAFVSQWG